MALPIILLVGHSGVGKDTIADMFCDPIYKQNAIKIALADPIKRIAKFLFHFTDEQLWGESKNRDIIDPKLTDNTFYDNYYHESAKYKLSSRDLSIFNKFENLNIIYNWLRNGDSTHWSNKSPRDIIKMIGETYVNSKDRYFWANYAKQTAKELLAGGYTYTPQEGLIKKEGSYYENVIIADGRHLTEVVTFAEIGAKIVWIYGDTKISHQSHRSVKEIDKISINYFDYCIGNHKSENRSTGVGSLDFKIRDMIYKFKGEYR